MGSEHVVINSDACLRDRFVKLHYGLTLRSGGFSTGADGVKTRDLNAL